MWKTLIPATIRNTAQTASRAAVKTSPRRISSPANTITLNSKKISIKPIPKTTTTIELERQTLHPERSETSNSGTDNEVAEHKSSYDPSTTSPEIELQALEEECRLQGIANPLSISPANTHVSEFLDPMAEGAAHNAEKMGHSGRGLTRKGKEVHIRRDVRGSQFEKLLEKLKRIQELRKDSSPQGS